VPELLATDAWLARPATPTGKPAGTPSCGGSRWATVVGHAP